MRLLANTSVSKEKRTRAEEGTRDGRKWGSVCPLVESVDLLTGLGAPIPSKFTTQSSNRDLPLHRSADLRFLPRQTPSFVSVLYKHYFYFCTPTSMSVLLYLYVPSCVCSSSPVPVSLDNQTYLRNQV